MKRFSAFLLLSLTIFFASTSLWASDDYKDGYRSKFYGTVEVMPEGQVGSWVVNGRTVVVTTQTRIEEEYGRAQVGAYVEIKGKSDGQTLQARKIEVKRGTDGDRDDDSYSHSSEHEFYGVVNSLPQGDLGTWLIGDREVFVDTQTRIKRKYGHPAVGATVEVEGRYRNDTFHAREIEVKQSR